MNWHHSADYTLRGMAVNICGPGPFLLISASSQMPIWIPGNRSSVNVYGLNTTSKESWSWKLNSLIWWMEVQQSREQKAHSQGQGMGKWQSHEEGTEFLKPSNWGSPSPNAYVWRGVGRAWMTEGGGWWRGRCTHALVRGQLLLQPQLTAARWGRVKTMPSF